MIEMNFYDSDCGCIKLMNKKGEALMLHNTYGDGMFKFFVVSSIHEFIEEKKRWHESVNPTYLRLNLKAEDEWKVMDNDTDLNYDDHGVFLKGNADVYAYGTTFVFEVR